MSSNIAELVCSQSNNCDKMDELSYSNNKFLLIMEKMGYKSGAGLGKTEQGITKPLDVTYQLGKRGFGMKLKNSGNIAESWDFSTEEVAVKENIIWLNHTKNNVTFSKLEMTNWIIEGIPNESVENEHHFCNPNILKDIQQAKEIFNEMDFKELMHARLKSNPFETIRSVFFMNRAALKIANIDAATDFMFSKIDEDIYHGVGGPFYFADVCAGPGGFTEYILWRKKWYFKGFGLTLIDENDFKLNESTCASGATFQPLYGETGDGNVCCPANILNFKRSVLHETNGKGVHFMMSDGGFSVEGNEDLQEVLSKNIYVCQCLVALEILRYQGHFVTKLFDIFTPYSVGLIYLMYNCFEKVTILKPNTSRPANAERYLVCSRLKRENQVKEIKSYLWVIVERLWELRNDKEFDILEIVPLDIIKKDERFFKYIVESNNSLGKKQIIGLKKMAAFCRNPTLIETRQEELRKQCLKLWQIPDKPKEAIQQIPIKDLLSTVIDRPEILLVQPREINNLKDLNLKRSDIEDWHFCWMCSSRKSPLFSFFVGTNGSKTYRLQNSKWVKVNNLQLCKGTVLYGEFVKETVYIETYDEKHYRSSLHVIDALQLGEKCLANMNFTERMELIRIYCKSVNKESQEGAIRIRQKRIAQLKNLHKNDLVVPKTCTNYVSVLPVFGLNSLSEGYDVNSVWLLKTNQSQSFHSTFVLKVQIFISSMKDDGEGNFTVEEILSALNNR